MALPVGMSAQAYLDAMRPGGGERDEDRSCGSESPVLDSSASSKRSRDADDEGDESWKRSRSGSSESEGGHASGDGDGDGNGDGPAANDGDGDGSAASDDGDNGSASSDNDGDGDDDSSFKADGLEDDQRAIVQRWRVAIATNLATTNFPRLMPLTLACEGLEFPNLEMVSDMFSRREALEFSSLFRHCVRRICALPAVQRRGVCDIRRFTTTFCAGVRAHLAKKRRFRELLEME